MLTSHLLPLQLTVKPIAARPASSARFQLTVLSASSTPFELTTAELKLRVSSSPAFTLTLSASAAVFPLLPFSAKPFALIAFTERVVESSARTGTVNPSKEVTNITIVSNQLNTLFHVRFIVTFSPFHPIDDFVFSLLLSISRIIPQKTGSDENFFRTSLSVLSQQNITIAQKGFKVKENNFTA